MDSSGNEIATVRSVLLETCARRILGQTKDVAAESSLVAEWDNCFENAVDRQELLAFCQLPEGEEVYSQDSSAKPSTSQIGNEQSSNWESEPYPPIEVIVDENSVDYEIYNQQPSTSSSVISSQQDSQQDIKIIQRIAELRNAGLWSSTRLPQCVDPPRKKTHWDFFLEEIKWMATDFRQEGKIKRRLAKKLASEAKQVWKRKFERKTIEKVDDQREAKRVCGLIARLVKDFWTSVDKIIDYKIQEILKARKRKALNQHLDQLVVQTDRLSSKIYVDGRAELNPLSSSRNSIEDAEDYEEELSDVDDETTIAMEERKQNKNLIRDERRELQKEADMELDDFISSLPASYLETLTNVDQNRPDITLNTVTEKLKGNKESETTIESNPIQDLTKQPANTPTNELLSHVDYAKLKSTNSDVRQQELSNIAKEAQKFQPKGYTLDTTQIKTEVPFLINGNLREYQLVGLDWMVTLYEKNLNGILADEMGLGKTIQTIALLAHLACERTIWGPHLIIVPTSVILNWEIELKKWCPSFKVITYFGTAKERAEKRKGWSKNNAFHVCITSYKLVTQDIRVFKKKAWQYMILDEAQNIKNFKSQRWQTLLNIRTRRRLLLTGTPLQNNLMELWSLLHFLLPAVFSSMDDFKLWFNNPMTSMVEGNTEVDKALVNRLHKVLRPFILRRLKCDVEKQLPTKEEKIIRCPLSKRQRFLYNEFLSKKTTIQNLQSGNMMSVLNIIMQLRKCCNHPNLFEARPVVSALVLPSSQVLLPQFLCLSEEVANSSCSFTNSVPSILRLKNSFALNSEWNLFDEVSRKECISRDMNAGPQEILRKIKGIHFAHDQNFRGGSIYLKETIANKTTPADDKNAFVEKVTLKNRKRRATLMLEDCLSVAENNSVKALDSTVCKERPAKRICFFQNNGLDIIRQKRIKKNRSVGIWLSEMRRLHGAPALSQESIFVLRKSLENVAQKSQFYNSFELCGKSLKLAKHDRLFEEACSMISDSLSNWAIHTVKRFLLYVNKLFLYGAPIEFKNLRAHEQYEQSCGDQQSKSLMCSHSEEIADQVRLSHSLQFPELRLIEYDCGKLQVLAKLLTQLFENKHRVLIFTQMSRMLDILQSFLSYHNFKYFRLDGSTPIDQRQAMTERFNTDDSIFCFILSTRSGGVGVNLIGADTVIFYDSDWNPTMDAQAQDRCHRIGQTRNVTIYRLISEKTIEENILKKAMQKKRLGEMAIDEAEFTPDFFRNTDNIRDLFNNEDGLAELVTPIIATGNSKDIELAMAEVEDSQDVSDAHKARAEANIDIAEFDENSAPVASQMTRDAESPLDQYTELVNSMKPVEQYAIRFLEEHMHPLGLDEEEMEDLSEQSADNRLLVNNQLPEEYEVENAESMTMIYESGMATDEVVAPSSKLPFRRSKLKKHRKTNSTATSAESSRSSTRLKGQMPSSVTRKSKRVFV